MIDTEQIEREWVFGMRTQVQEVVSYLDNDRLLYPAGRSLVVHSFSGPKQSFVPFIGQNSPAALALSQKRDLLAVCFSGSPASVELWNTESMQREKVLGSPEVVSKNYVFASFSNESKMLVAQGGEPDWTLVLFNVEKGKVFSILRLTDTQEFGSVTSVCFHPQDTAILSIVGEGILRMMRLHDKLLKTWGYPGGHEHTCVCQEWVDVHILLVGTNKASVLVLEDGELRATLNVTHSDLTKWEKSEGETEIGMNSVAELGKVSLPRHRRVTSIRSYEGGFICACGPDKVFVFRKSENIHEYFTQRLVMRVCEPSTAAKVSGRGDHTITCLSISPNQSQAVAATDSGQLFVNKMPSQEESQMQTLKFKPLHSLFHDGDITDVDTCLWKPIIVTCGKDRTIRTWNLDQQKLLFHHTFKEDIYSVSLHPTGLHLAVGLTDALHLYHVMFDDLRHYSEFKIRRCALSKFSWGGQYLAATDSNLLTLFSAIFLKRITTLKGHTNKIKGIAWLPGDSSLVSCSADGGIFGWDLQTSSVAWEIRTTHCSFLTSGMFSVENEGPTILSGNSEMIYHLNIAQMVEEGKFSLGRASCIAFSPVKGTVVIGTLEGFIFVYKFPALVAQNPKKLGAHASSVSRIIITRDEEKMITCGTDGVIVIWKLPKVTDDAGELSAVLEKVSQLPKVPEMLVAQKDIEEMLSKLSELERLVQYLKKDKSHHLTLQFKEFESQKEKMVKENDQIVASLHSKIQKLESKIESEKENYRKEYTLLEEGFKSTEDDLKEELRQKLLYQYDKQDKIEQSLSDLKLQNEEDKKIWKEKAATELQENLAQKEMEIKNLNHRLQKVTAELEQERVEGAHLLRLVEASTEVELGKARSSLHSQLAEEQKRSTKLREERASLQRKISIMESEKESCNIKIRDLDQSRNQLEEKVSSLEENLLLLRKEVQYRNTIIANREEEMNSKKEIIEEERKTKLLQEHHIAWLKEQLEPTKEALRSKTEEMKQMEEEISDARLQIEGRDRQVRHLSQKLSASQGYNSLLRRKLHVASTRCLRLEGDVAKASEVIHQPQKLKEAVHVLSNKHLEKGNRHEIWTRSFLTSGRSDSRIDPQMGRSLDIKEDSYQELLRQRRLLENAVQTLQQKIKKDDASHSSKVTSMFNENRILLDQVKELNKKICILEASLKTKAKPKKPPHIKKNNLPKVDLSLPPKNPNSEDEPTSD